MGLVIALFCLIGGDSFNFMQTFCRGKSQTYSCAPAVHKSSPRHIHPQGDNRCVDRSEGQLLKLSSVVLSRHISLPLKVHLQMSDAADA